MAMNFPLMSVATKGELIGMAPPFTLTTDTALVLVVVASPERLQLVMDVGAEKQLNSGEIGVPVVVTDPLPPPTAVHVLSVGPQDFIVFEVVL